MIDWISGIRYKSRQRYTCIPSAQPTHINPLHRTSANIMAQSHINENGALRLPCRYLINLPLPEYGLLSATLNISKIENLPGCSEICDLAKQYMEVTCHNFLFLSHSNITQSHSQMYFRQRSLFWMVPDHLRSIWLDGSKWKHSFMWYRTFNWSLGVR